MREVPDMTWNDVSHTVQVELKKKKYELAFRTVNLADVFGAEHLVIIER
jgi:hypothetical protein